MSTPGQMTSVFQRHWDKPMGFGSANSPPCLAPFLHSTLQFLLPALNLKSPATTPSHIVGLSLYYNLQSVNYLPDPTSAFLLYYLQALNKHVIPPPPSSSPLHDHSPIQHPFSSHRHILRVPEISSRDREGEARGGECEGWTGGREGN